jgi:hypothetical protein
MRSYELMQNMIDEDLSLLWMSGTFIHTYSTYIPPKYMHAYIDTYIHTYIHIYIHTGAYSRPETLILWTVPVPPVPIRPSVQQDLGGGNHHTYIHAYFLLIIT